MDWQASPTDTWIPNYEAWVNTLPQVLETVLETRLVQIQQWMYEHHRWKNRTGAAEAQLFATSVIEDSALYIAFGYGWATFYSYYLENNPKYAMLGQALDYWSPILFDDVKRALSG